METQSPETERLPEKVVGSLRRECSAPLWRSTRAAQVRLPVPGDSRCPARFRNVFVFVLHWFLTLERASKGFFEAVYRRRFISLFHSPGMALFLPILL